MLTKVFRSTTLLQQPRIAWGAPPLLYIAILFLTWAYFFIDRFSESGEWKVLAFSDIMVLLLISVTIVQAYLMWSELPSEVQQIGCLVFPLIFMIYFQGITHNLLFKGVSAYEYFTEMI